MARKAATRIPVKKLQQRFLAIRACGFIGALRIAGISTTIRNRMHGQCADEIWSDATESTRRAPRMRLRYLAVGGRWSVIMPTRRVVRRFRLWRRAERPQVQKADLSYSLGGVCFG